MQKVGIVILNYNDAETTIHLLEEIRNYEILDQIVIVDNESTDNSYETLLKYCSNHIHILRSGHNGGYGYGNNVGIKFLIEQMKIPFCIIANPDVEFEERTVEKLLRFMEETDDCGVVTGKQIGRYASAWRDTSILGDIIFNSLVLNKIFKPRYYSKDYLSKKICQVYAVPGCFFMARSQALVDIGMYDEDFFLFEEEKVIAMKLQRQSWKTYLINDVEYKHNHSVSIKKSITKLGESKRLVLRSNELYLKKYRGISKKYLPLLHLFYKYSIFESVLCGFVRGIIKKKG